MRLVKGFHWLPCEERLRLLGLHPQTGATAAYKVFSGRLDLDPASFLLPWEATLPQKIVLLNTSCKCLEQVAHFYYYRPFRQLIQISVGGLIFKSPKTVFSLVVVSLFLLLKGCSLSVGPELTTLESQHVIGLWWITRVKGMLVIIPKMPVYVIWTEWIQ